MHAKQIVIVALGAVVALTSVGAADQAADEAAIRANVEEYVEAYNRRDSKTMADMWSPEAVYMDPTTGEGVVGREAIAKQFDYTFAGSEDAKLEVTVDSIEFVSPNVAIEKGTAEVTYSDADPERTEYTAVHVKRDGQWLIDRVSETEIEPPPPSNYEHLKELEWLVGTWIDQDENATIRHECNWTKNQNFLTRSFALVVGDEINMSGMQIIGWDPTAKQIRSWVFDSDGTFGEGKWTRKDDRWLIQQVVTLADGRKSSGLSIIKPIDNDSYTWQTVNRDLDGEVLPNIEEIQIVRESSFAAEDVVSVDVEFAPADANTSTETSEPADASQPADANAQQ